MKDLQLDAENLRKRLQSPKDQSMKVISPTMVGKIYPTESILGRTTPKKEDRFFFDAQKKIPLISKIQYTQDERIPRTSASPDLKAAPTGRSGFF